MNVEDIRSMSEQLEQLIRNVDAIIKQRDEFGEMLERVLKSDMDDLRPSPQLIIDIRNAIYGD